MAVKKEVPAKEEVSPKKKKSKKSGSDALKVAGGLLAGAAAGALAGVLLAPDSGKNTRKKITAKSKKVASDVSGKVSKTIKDLESRVKKISSAKSGSSKKRGV
jgi:gas vesicle protein